MTPEEQWDEINAGRPFLIEVLDKVKEIWDALDVQAATATEVVSGVGTGDGVPITIRDDGGLTFELDIGENIDGHAQLSVRIPKTWATVLV
jgi:hypothetical protein